MAGGKQSRRNGAFYGDAGIARDLRDNMSQDQNPGAGYKGNDVDISQRYAQSESDVYLQRAEAIAQSLARGPMKYAKIFADPEQRRDWVEGLAERLRDNDGDDRATRENRSQMAAPKEEPVLSRSADNAFWNNPDELKKASRAVRPPNL